MIAGEGRPFIAIPGRFAENTSVTRFSAIVTARKLAEMVWWAGGEPVTFLPVPAANWSERMSGIHGVLMPGGGDVDPSLYGQVAEDDKVYGVDPEQDKTDISLINYAIKTNIPMLTICRGTQIANIALGGTLIQHMEKPHINTCSRIIFDEVDSDLGLTLSELNISCYHHQIIDKPGFGIKSLALSNGEHIEAVRYTDLTWGFGLQWHPEDNYIEEHGQQQIILAFVAAAKRYKKINSKY